MGGSYFDLGLHRSKHFVGDCEFLHYFYSYTPELFPPKV